MSSRAKNETVPAEHWDQLYELIWKHADNFGIKFSEMPARVEPLRIGLATHARPVHVKLRIYSELQRFFMNSFVADLLRQIIALDWTSVPTTAS